MFLQILLCFFILSFSHFFFACLKVLFNCLSMCLSLSKNCRLLFINSSLSTVIYWCSWCWHTKNKKIIQSITRNRLFSISVFSRSSSLMFTNTLFISNVKLPFIVLSLCLVVSSRVFYVLLFIYFIVSLKLVTVVLWSWTYIGIYVCFYLSWFFRLINILSISNR